MVSAPCVSAERAVVPLRIHNGYPILVAKVDGKSVPLVFDLGADFHLTLSESALAGLDAIPLNETYAFSDAKGNILQSPMFKLRRIEIGEVAFTDVVGHIDTSHPTYKAQTDGREGMIGAPFLQKYKVVLDYIQREMTLIPGESAVPGGDECTGTEVPFLPEWQGSAVTKATTDAGELTMVWDTGAPLSMIRKGRAQASGLKIEDSILNSAKFELAGVDFGPLQLRVFDYVEPAGTDGFIGHTFFERNVVCIDFPRNRLFIAR
jgi:predicted aspartyl protease